MCECPDNVLAGNITFEEDVNDGFKIIANVTVGTVLVVWDVQPVSSAVKCLVEVFP